MNRLTKAFILLSVLLNILLLGVVFGYVGKETIPLAGPLNSELVDKLPPNDRQLYLDAMRKFEIETKDLHAELDALRAQAGDILNAEPLDKKAYLAKAEEIHALRGQIMRHMVRITTALAQQLDDEGRAVLAEGVRKHNVRPHNCNVYKQGQAK
jgi:uncharacterized membrane protein